jgi:hypothetical protein
MRNQAWKIFAVPRKANEYKALQDLQSFSFCFSSENNSRYYLN